MVSMRTFSKAQIASLLASGVDFGVTFLLLQWLGVPPVAASARVTFYGASGTLCGGVTHFMISRTWVFNAQEQKWVAQLNRYVLVWVGNYDCQGCHCHNGRCLLQLCTAEEVCI